MNKEKHFMTRPTKNIPAAEDETAHERHEHQVDDAAILKHEQERQAARLCDRQKNASGQDLDRSQKSAAIALEHCQKDHADALQTAHDDHEARLKRFQKAEQGHIEEKDQVVNWLMGNYSVANKKKKEE
jgi:hypothetical protein